MKGGGRRLAPNFTLDVPTKRLAGIRPSATQTNPARPTIDAGGRACCDNRARRDHDGTPRSTTAAAPRSCATTVRVVELSHI